MFNTLAFGMPSMGEWVIVAVVGLLFFGKRLPEVGRSLGKGIVEFKKGLKGIEEEIDDQVDDAQRQQEQRRIASTTPSPGQAQPRFDPYTGKPLVEPAHRFDPYTGQPLAQDHADQGPADSNGAETSSGTPTATGH